MTKFVSLFATASLTALGLGACSGGSDSAREEQIEELARQHGVDADVTLGVDGDVEQVAVKGLGGATVGKNLAMPDGFPDDIVVDAGWNIMGTNTIPTGGYMVQAMSESGAPAILEMLRSAMTAKGWAETASEQPVGSMTKIGFEKEDRMAVYTIIAAGPQRTIQLMTMKKPG